LICRARYCTFWSYLTAITLTKYIRLPKARLWCPGLPSPLPALPCLVIGRAAGDKGMPQVHTSALLGGYTNLAQGRAHCLCWEVNGWCAAAQGDSDFCLCARFRGVRPYHCHRQACCRPRYRTLHAQSQHPVRPPPSPSMKAYPRASGSCTQRCAHMHRHVTPTHLPLLQLPTKGLEGHLACAACVCLGARPIRRKPWWIFLSHDQRLSSVPISQDPPCTSC
jgi:hypothetical protein